MAKKFFTSSSETMKSLWSRRSLLKGTVAGATGLVVAGTGSGFLSVAHANGSPDSIKRI